MQRQYKIIDFIIIIEFIEKMKVGREAQRVKAHMLGSKEAGRQKNERLKRQIV
jgi:hypothetical protein